ncbi:MAG: DNA adenine methylase [Phycisphaerales bacterium]|nr:DNA adenine methylase [Hyphomonadaceae bacterium]
MVSTASPLRYPGGKACLFDLATSVLELNDLERGHYAEPYAGGCGLALKLLYGGHVSDIHINDIDPGVWAFWHCVLNRTDAFVARVQKTPVTIKEWRRQQAIYGRCDTSKPLALGFATFFLNRTNRSGVIKDAGVIGGLKQNGEYKIGCRFNRDDLSKRIRRVAKYRDRIHLTNMDAIHFMRRCEKKLPECSLLFIDPPYYKKGSSLYTSFYLAKDHARVAEVVTGLENPWIVTYDDAPEIRQLYKGRRQYCFDINYSLNEKRLGTELLIASKGLKIPAEARERQVNRPQYR